MRLGKKIVRNKTRKKKQQEDDEDEQEKEEELSFVIWLLE